MKRVMAGHCANASLLSDFNKEKSSQYFIVLSIFSFVTYCWLLLNWSLVDVNVKYEVDKVHYVDTWVYVMGLHCIDSVGLLM